MPKPNATVHIDGVGFVEVICSTCRHYRPSYLDEDGQCSEAPSDVAQAFPSDSCQGWEVDEELVEASRDGGGEGE